LSPDEHSTKRQVATDQLKLISMPISSYSGYTVSQEKNCPCSFVSNSVKHWQKFQKQIIFDMQHPKETGCK